MKRNPRSKSNTWATKRARVPQVGIFFLVGDKLLVDHTPVSEGETYGHFKIHERGHDTYWEMLKQAGTVPPSSEYDEYPRGRVAYDTKIRTYMLFADRCILKKKSAVNAIMSRLDLPVTRTKTDADSHYQCPRCLRKGTEHEPR